MRIAEALLLGSTMLKPLAGEQNDGHGNGCALGMIGKASGIFCSINVTNMREEHRWLYKNSYTPLPCNCSGDLVMGSCCQLETRLAVEEDPASVLVHLFNYHVATEKDWSIEQLAEWLDSIDPTPLKVKVTVEITQQELVEV